LSFTTRVSDPPPERLSTLGHCRSFILVFKKNGAISFRDTSAILVEVGRELIKPGSIVQILVEIESYNIRNLGPFNFTKPVFGNFDFILSTNIPEPFQYKIPDGIILEGAGLGSMSLMEFTNATPPIVSYKVVSYSRTWIVPQNAGIENFTFPLTSLKFEKNVGITEKKLMSSK
jgi:hypothetical protein